ncbi:YfhO family protein, partial [Patescibacteria group bacterium]|nr:YfhO family protein [Patescibacteria group bacterium]
LGSIATFGGFRLDYSDWNLTEEQFEPILKPWISFYKSPSFTLLSISITLLSLTGLLVLIYTTTKKKNSQHLPLILSWLFALTMLGTNIPLLKSFTTWLSANLPLFGQLFRFTFTKFSISYVFIISILVGVALSWLLKLKIQQYFVNSILVIFMGVVIYLAHPAFNGFFFYPALRIKLPKQYQQLTTYLNQDFNQSRVISFPIHSLWGWTTGTHNWGYRGSGFIWQALELPFIDRSFDPWSKYNETLFLQSNLALYRQDQAAFLKTFEKYHTDLIWYDNSIFHPGNYPENLFATEAHHFFDQTGQINLIQDELPLQLYQIDGSQPGRSIFAPPKAQVLDPDYAHEYTSFDQAYLSYGDYIFGKDYSLSFPFSYLQQEQVFTPQITNNHLIFTLSNLENQQLVIPNLANYQSQIMSVITGSVQNNQITLKIQTQLPYIANQTQEVYVQEINLPFETMSTFIIQFNQGKIEINPYELTADSQVITYLFATTDKNIEGKVINQKQDLVADFKLPIKDWLDSFDHQISQINNQDKIKINVPLGLNREFIFSDHPQRNESTHLNCSRPQQGTVQKSVLESGVTYLAQNKGIFCDTRYFSELKSEFQYLFHWQGEVLSGAGVRGFLLNPHTKRFDLDIGANKDSFNQWYGVYPSKNSYQAKGTQDYFGFILNGESYGKDKNQVSLQALEFYTLPLNWLTSIHTNNQNQLIFKTELIKTKKINTVLYQVKAKINSETGLIVLPQAYDQGWIAFKPFGKNFKHLKFNGWANAWEIPAGEHEIIIFYWPQLLVFGGYGVLIGTSIYLIIATAKKNKQHHKYSKIKHKTKHYLRGK